MLGLACYLALALTAIVRGDTVGFAHTVLALAAVIFSTYLLYVQAELIGAVCDWCLVSDGLVTGLAILALLRMKLAQDLVVAAADRAQRA